jgi:hypothetical protein
MPSFLPWTEGSGFECDLILLKHCGSRLKDMETLKEGRLIPELAHLLLDFLGCSYGLLDLLVGETPTALRGRTASFKD